MRILSEFCTPLEPCPYLPGQRWKLNVRWVGSLSQDELDEELASGGRRFGSALFRPDCPACQECVPLRIPVADFRPSKSQRRVLRKNADLEVTVGEPLVSEERLELHRRFHSSRHASHSWPRSIIDFSEYFESFVDNVVPTLEFCYRLESTLVAVAYVGESTRAFNSIYAFHDPDLARRGLGTYDLLCELGEAKRRGKEYVYLGYNVEGCRSMEYKSTYYPHELRIDGEWRRVEKRNATE